MNSIPDQKDIINCWKSVNKDKMLKAVREIRYITYRGKKGQTDFSSKTMFG